MALFTTGKHDIYTVNKANQHNVFVWNIVFPKHRQLPLPGHVCVRS